MPRPRLRLTSSPRCAECFLTLKAELAVCKMPARWMFASKTPRNSLPWSVTTSMPWDTACSSTGMPACRHTARNPAQVAAAEWSSENEQ